MAAARRDATPSTIARDPDLADLLGDPVAATAYTVLVRDASGDASLVDEHPDLAALVLSWWQHRDQPGDTDRCGAVRGEYFDLATLAPRG